MPSVKLSRALRKESALRGHVRDGAGAIARRHRPLIAADQIARIGDSLDLDAGTKAGREQEHRWDYLLSLPDAKMLVAVEPHSASSDREVRVVVEKKKAATTLLREELRPEFKVASWHWVSTRGGFSRSEPAVRALNQNGIKFHDRRIRSLD